MLLNILKTPKDLQLSKWSKEPTHISQLRLLNIISLLSVYLSQSKKKWWEFSHGAPQLQEAFDKIFTL
jgi:hypothetical protein